MDDTITTKDAHKATYWQDIKFQVALIYAVTGKMPDTFEEKGGHRISGSTNSRLLSLCPDE
ncbi:hypothetical protein [Peribacillus frigoritolerans]|uniref:hypothetical protein n=1 Tax=Peribacillus frigoritolerans TaxID=450367 RepID=UPI00227DE575|nr:hypothetical protein [Peribacillus frigoritolerans]MCY9139724.1 hypothetical protein [Peribacillus frigoritolerans]